MTYVANSAGVLKQAVAAKRVDASGVLRDVAMVYVANSAGVLKPTTGGGFGFAATSSPASVVGNGASAAAIQVTTAYTTVSVTGGTPPYTYSWAGIDPDWEAVYATSSTTPFRSGYLSPGDISETDFVCTVTDSLGATADTNSVHVKGRNRGI